MDEYTYHGKPVATPLVKTGTDSEGITATEDDIYVADFYDGTVGEYDLATGATVNASLITGSVGTYGVAVANNLIYVTNYYQGTLTAYTETSSPVEQWTVTGLGNGTTGSVVVEGTHVFVVHSPSGSDSSFEISAYNALTGAVENATLVTGLYDTYGLAISGSKLYVDSYGGGTIGEYTVKGKPINANLVTDVPDGADGMCVKGNTLYVADISTVRIYNATTGASEGEIDGLSQANSVAIVPQD